MSGDEVLVLIACGLITLVGWGRWYRMTGAAAGFGAARDRRALLYVIPLLCLALLFSVLKLAASHDVRDSWPYLIMYVVMGAAWVVLWTAPMRLLGVSPRDDALERGNPAASYAVAGAILGLTLTFAGGNIGNGPGWWVVVFSAGMATLTLLLTWAIVQALGGTSELVSVERDVASGVRLGASLAAAGLICGRGAAGDWTGAENAARDFALIAWPVLPLAVVEVVASRILKPTPQWPKPSVFASGVLPAAVYLALAAAYVWEVGPWSIPLER
jgi:uncharacterized membrane protein YjfL (UPF0719 family)